MSPAACPCRARSRLCGALCLLVGLACGDVVGPDPAPENGAEAADEVLGPLCGDADGDGRFETEDIQRCLDALPEGEPGSVTLVPGVVFEPPREGEPFYNEIGLVELASRTTLDCQGSAIRGVDAEAMRAPSPWGPLWVVTNSDHQGDTQHDIWVRDCEIDGGMPGSYSPDDGPFDSNVYMGFGFYGVTRGGLAESWVHDTHHSCIYARNSKDILIERNRLTDCGAANYEGLYGQPAVYLFQSGSTVQERIVVRENDARRAGSQLYNTRVSQRNAEYQTAWMREVRFEDNLGDQEGNGLPCFMLRGLRDSQVVDNTCVETAGIQTSALSESFCSDNPPRALDGTAESSCLERILIEGNVLIDSLMAKGYGAITIYAHHDGIEVRDNEIRGADPLAAFRVPCFRWETPVRDLVIAGLDVSGCDGRGVEQASSSLEQVAAPPREHVVFEDIAVDGSGLEGFLGRTRLEGLLVDGLRIRGSGLEGIRMLGLLLDSALSNVAIDGLRDPPAATLVRLEETSGVDLESVIVENALGPAIWLAAPTDELHVVDLTCAQPAFGAGIDAAMSVCLRAEPGSTGWVDAVCLENTGTQSCVEGLPAP